MLEELGDTCGELAMVNEWMGMAVSQVGFSEGTCAEQGYTEPAGSKDFDIELVGKITATLYTKTSDKASVMSVDASAAGLRAVRADNGTDKKHLYHIFNGQCGEAAVSSWAADALSALGFSKGTCEEQGYTVPAGSNEIDIPFVGKIETKLFDKPGDEQPKHKVRLYCIFLEKCGEAEVPSWVGDALTSMGFSSGTCSEQGYAVPAGAKEIDVPLVGKVEIKLFDKAGDEQPNSSSSASSLGAFDAKSPSVQAEQDDVAVNAETALQTEEDGKLHVYQVISCKCGEAAVDSWMKHVLAGLGLQEGTCAEQGYTKADGNKELSVPIMGNVELNLYGREEETRYFMIALEKCGEAALDACTKELATNVGLAEGTCLEQGYSVPAGSQELSMPISGGSAVSLNLQLYSQASRRLLLI